ncbi:Endophilin-A3 [Dissostichus eleginoides]|uniref:Endophilin-A3 n=1 Tax=Dissostichus eleginoides TaxID=100907 RepID=A0AAD9BYR5_DISEL|nr:Endophilin-A3 [Dissostichus eleginoides]
MSVAGLKKQFHKASQLLSEKISGAEGTKLHQDFVEMERKIDVTNKSVFDLLSKTTEYLQPNPASRAKLNMLNTMSKIRGQVKTTGYPQAEGLLGDCMLRHGQDLGEDSIFGCALTDMGEGHEHLQDKDLKEITHHLKKLEGRRLDFDYKKKRQGKIPDEEIRQAVEKFDESRELAERSMFHFLENDVSQLAALMEAALQYHRRSEETLLQLRGRLQERISTASSRSRGEFRCSSMRSSVGVSSQQGGLKPTESELLDQPCCRSLYGFEPENQGELGFKEGDIIILTNQIDENWYEGMIHGESGFFPISYVEVLVPLPQ